MASKKTRRQFPYQQRNPVVIQDWNFFLNDGDLVCEEKEGNDTCKTFGRLVQSTDGAEDCVALLPPCGGHGEVQYEVEPYLEFW